MYIEDGEAHKEVVNFKPFLGIHAMKSEQTKWTDIFGRPVKITVFNSIMEMKSWKKENGGYLEILGDIAPHIQFIATQYRKEIPLQTVGLVIWNVDIEVDPSVIDYERKIKVRSKE